jgi:hypothetical protein
VPVFLVHDTHLSVRLISFVLAQRYIANDRSATVGQQKARRRSSAGGAG